MSPTANLQQSVEQSLSAPLVEANVMFGEIVLYGDPDLITQQTPDREAPMVIVEDPITVTVEIAPDVELIFGGRTE